MFLGGLVFNLLGYGLDWFTVSWLEAGWGRSTAVWWRGRREGSYGQGREAAIRKLCQRHTEAPDSRVGCSFRGCGGTPQAAGSASRYKFVATPFPSPAACRNAL